LNTAEARRCFLTTQPHSIKVEKAKIISIMIIFIQKLVLDSK